MNDLTITALMFENFEMSFSSTPLKLKFDGEQTTTPSVAKKEEERLNS
jgi:hypothetical protein